MKPILFNTEMVRAILDDRKTVTRRVVKDKDIINAWDCESDGTPIAYINQSTGDHYPPTFTCRYKSGDILYVRETWFYEEHMHDATAGEPDLPSGRYSHRYIFKAEDPDYPVNIGAGATGWRPAIHMPKEAARIFLLVTDVRVERLQDITENQAEKEGTIFSKPKLCNDKECDDCEYHVQCQAYVFNFIKLWNSTVKPAAHDGYGWDANPWVWVIQFERISKAEAKT